MNDPRATLLRSLLLPMLAVTAGGCGKKATSTSPGTVEPARAEPVPTASASAAPPVAPPLPRARIADAALPLTVFRVNHYEVAPTLAEAPTPSDSELRVFDVGGRMVVAPTFATLADGQLSDETPDGFTPFDFPGSDYKDQPIGANWLSVQTIVGSYPDDLWVTAHGTWGFVAPRAGYPVEHTYFYQRQYGHWGRVQDAPIAAAPWSHGRTLAFLEGSGRFALARPGKGKLGDLPKQAAGKSGHTRIAVEAMTALRSGEVFAAGADADAEDGFALEVWGGDTGDALAQSSVIPLGSFSTRRAAANAGDRGNRLRPGTWVFAWKGRVLVLANGDGEVLAAEVRGAAPAQASAWGAPTRFAMPVTHVDEADAAEDGTLYFTSGGALYRSDGPQDGAPVFTRAAMPVTIERTTGVFAQARDKVFLGVFAKGERSVLLWTGEAREALPAPVDAGPPGEAPKTAGSTTPAADLLGRFPALAAGCTTPAVVFFPVSSSTPKDFPFPRTRRTLQDFPSLAKLRVVDFEAYQERYLGAGVPDEATATALVEHWNARDAKSKSRAVCFAAPAGARVLVMR